MMPIHIAFKEVELMAYIDKLARITEGRTDNDK